MTMTKAERRFRRWAITACVLGFGHIGCWIVTWFVDHPAIWAALGTSSISNVLAWLYLLAQFISLEREGNST